MVATCTIPFRPPYVSQDVDAFELASVTFSFMKVDPVPMLSKRPNHKHELVFCKKHFITSRVCLACITCDLNHHPLTGTEQVLLPLKLDCHWI